MKLLTKDRMGEKKLKAPIGVFDSGVGGLTVAREIMRQLPNENIVYFGDTARVPYGSKSKDMIIRYSRQDINFLQTKKVKAIVVACNTASAVALEEIKDEYQVPILGVVEPGAMAAAEATQNGNIGIIGTEATIKSGIYNNYLRKIKPNISIVSKACPLFVPLVEEGLIEDRVTDDIVGRYLGEFKEYQIDALILGCTHYPFLSNSIARFMGPEVKLVNPAYETAKQLKELLKQKNILNEGEEKVIYDFYVSDAVDKFNSFANGMLPIQVESSSVVNIENY